MLRPRNWSDLMGESKKEALRVDFGPSVKLEFHGRKSRVTAACWFTGNWMRRWV